MNDASKRANYIGAPHVFNLDQACRVLSDAFGFNIYLVGSSLERRDYRDVDVRCILDDADFARLFPGLDPGSSRYHALWSVLCASISEWLSQRTGLPIDFQIQQMTHANAKFSGPRHAMGAFFSVPPDKP